MKVIGVIYQNKYYIGLEERINLHSSKAPSAWIALRKPYLLEEDGSLQKLEMLSLIVPEKTAIFVPSVQIMYDYLDRIDNFKKNKSSGKVVPICSSKRKCSKAKEKSASK